MRMPRQDECNPNDPEEHALWALVCPPGIGQTPMLIPEFVARRLSEALWHAGFRHHPEMQTKKFQRPFRGPQHALNPMGKWVDMGEESPEPVVLPNLAEMTAEELAVIMRQAQELGIVPEVPAPVDTARVID
jgi:hypothetical protein